MYFFFFQKWPWNPQNHITSNIFWKRNNCLLWCNTQQSSHSIMLCVNSHIHSYVPGICYRSCQVLCVSKEKKAFNCNSMTPFLLHISPEIIKHDCFTLNKQYPFTTACSVLQTSLYISSVLKGPHYYVKGAGFIFGKLDTLGTKRLSAHWANGCICSQGMAECATSNRVQLTVPLWLCPLRNFSSDTELGIRSTSPVRRSPNKKRPYELLIVMAPLL